MDIDSEIPLKICINQDRREDRRRQASEMFRMHKLRVLRRPGAAAEKSRHLRGFDHMPRRAFHLSMLWAIRDAMRAKVPAMLIFEDDVILHEDFRDRVSGLDIPDDWGMIYFGCLHFEPPVLIAPNLVRVTKAMDLQALAIRGCHFETILRELRPSALPGGRAALGPFDVLLARLHKKIPTYAPWPNLAWQRVSASDMAGWVYSNYHPDGRQRVHEENTAGLPRAGL